MLLSCMTGGGNYHVIDDVSSGNFHLNPNDGWYEQQEQTTRAPHSGILLRLFLLMLFYLLFYSFHDTIQRFRISFNCLLHCSCDFLIEIEPCKVNADIMLMYILYKRKRGSQRHGWMNKITIKRIMMTYLIYMFSKRYPVICFFMPFMWETHQIY